MSSVAKRAWQISESACLEDGSWKGLRTRREWPASEEMGIRVVDSGKREMKTWGDQAPEVMTRRVHGTVVCVR